jgi:uncharacterized protein
MTSTAPVLDVMAPYSVAKVAGRYLVVNTLGNWALFEPDAYHRLLRGALSPSAVRTLVDEGVLRDRARPAFTKNHVLEALRPHCGGPSLHVIALGAGCNLDCVYCRTSVMRASSSARNPTTDDLERIVDFALSFPLKQQMLEFGVGEPTLRTEIMLHVIEYAERVAEARGKQVAFRLTTNGTHLDEATVERLVAHDVHISISLDGPADLHDKQRPRAGGQRGSFVSAARCIADLCRNRHYPKVSASTTITGWNVDHLDEIIDLYVDLGVEKVALRPVVAQGAAMSGGTDLLLRREALELAFPRALARIVELGAGGTRLQEAYLSFYCQQVFGDRRAMTEAMSPCGFGIGQLAYSPDGSIFGCEEYMSAGLPALGHVTRDTPTTIVHHPTVREVLEKSFLDDLACASCAFIPYCGQCPALAKLQTGSFLPTKSLTLRCAMTRAYQTFIFERAAVDDPALRGYCERYAHGWRQDLGEGVITSRRW